MSSAWTRSSGCLRDPSARAESIRRASGGPHAVVVPLFRAQQPTWLGLREVRDKEAHSIGEPLGRPLRNPEEGLNIGAPVNVASAATAAWRRSMLRTCRGRSCATAPGQCSDFQPNRRPGRGRTAGEISMVSRTGRLEVNGTFMAHKSGKSCSPVSASVNEPRTNRRIANILNGYLPFF